jgi:hypothetical protein
VKLRPFYARHRYGILFYTLLLSLAVPPLLKPFGFGGYALEILLATSLVAAVAAIDSPLLRRIALATVAVAFVTRLGAALLGQRALSEGSLAVWGLFALIAAATALRFALRGQAIGAEQIYAALGTYLLAGFFFGLIYWVLEQFAPGSLAVPGGQPLLVSTGVYYSFVTLASLGYGDVLPVSEAARGLAIAEVVGGQLYLAVMVARLVAAWR